MPKPSKKPAKKPAEGYDLAKFDAMKEGPATQARARRRAQVATMAKTGKTIQQKIEESAAMERARKRNEVAEKWKAKGSLKGVSRSGLVLAMMKPEKSGLFEAVRPYASRLLEKGLVSKERVIREGLTIKVSVPRSRGGGKSDPVFILRYEYPRFVLGLIGLKKTRTVIFDHEGKVISK